MHGKILNALGGVILVFVAACAGGGASGGDSAKATQAGGPADDAAVRKSIEALDTQFVAAFKKSDAATAAGFYEQDAISRPPNMEPESGRAAIEKGFTDLFKSVGKVDDFSAELKDLDVFADRAIEIGSYAMTFTPTGAKASQKDHGSYFNYWRKQPDGSWKIHRDLIVSATPMPGMNPPPTTPKK